MKTINLCSVIKIVSGISSNYSHGRCWECW